MHGGKSVCNSLAVPATVKVQAPPGIVNIFDEKYETTKDYSQMDRSFNFGIRRVY